MLEELSPLLWNEQAAAQHVPICQKREKVAEIATKVPKSSQRRTRHCAAVSCITGVRGCLSHHYTRCSCTHVCLSRSASSLLSLSLTWSSFRVNYSLSSRTSPLLFSSSKPPRLRRLVAPVSRSPLVCPSLVSPPPLCSLYQEEL